MAKRIIGLSSMVMMMLAMIIATALTVRAADSEVAGSGTQEDPYVITSGDEFELLDGSDAYFILGADISVDGSEFRNRDFSGVLDGNGYTLTFSYIINGYTYGFALFNTNAGTIQNLRMEFNVDCRLDDISDSVSAICKTNEGTISNCTVVANAEMTLWCTSYRSGRLSGICDSNEGVITSCTVLGELDADTSSAYATTYASGICDDNSGTISDCFVRAYIYGTTSNGIADSVSGSIKRCITAGTIYSYEDSYAGTGYVAGICRANNVDIEDCISFAHLIVLGNTTYSYGICGGGSGYAVNCVSAGIQTHYTNGSKVYRLGKCTKDSYDLGDLKLSTSGNGLDMDVIKQNNYTQSDFPTLDFSSSWEMTEYGIPCLKGVGAKLEAVEIIKDDNTMYIGVDNLMEVNLLPENTVLYSLDYSAEGCEVSTGTSSSRVVKDIIYCTPLEAGNTRLVATDAVKGIVGFANYNVEIPVEQIVIEGPSEVNVGEQIQLTATVLPDNATNKDFTWSVEYPDYCTVDENGLVTGLSSGATYVVVQSADGFVTERHYVCIKQAPESIELNKTELFLYPYESETLEVTIHPANTTNTSVIWTSSNPEVASVSSEGKVSAHKSGTTQISVKTNDGELYAYCDVVVGITASSVTIVGETVLEKGQSVQFTATVLPENVSDNSVLWYEICNPGEEILSIDENGLVTGLKGGETVLGVASADLFAHDQIRIYVIAHPERIELDKKEIFIPIGSSQDVIATVLPEDTTDMSVTWESSDANIATVENGTIMGHEPGEAIITVKTVDGGVSAQVIVHVYRPAESLVLEEDDITICVDELYEVIATVVPEDATYQNLLLSSGSSFIQIAEDKLAFSALRTGTAIVNVSTAMNEVTKAIMVTIVNHVYDEDNHFCINCGGKNPDYHEHSPIKVEKVEPGCETTGMKEHYSCDCGKLFEDEAGMTEILDKDSLILAATGHDWADATCTTPKECNTCGITEGEALGHTWTPSTTEDGEKIEICHCGETRKLLNGWVSEHGKWAFYVDNVKVTSCWKKDSQGWCYIGADGYMKTNAWIQDSQGWCYVGANGYCVTNTWKKDSQGWCYLDANGRMAVNKWIEDSQGWCYVGENGYCVTNCWKKDSQGWCYLDANGRMAVNKWIKDSQGWCYLGANGYCVTNIWMKDSQGWCYLDANGRMAVSRWIKDSKGWCYVGSDGYMVTNCWVEDSSGPCYIGPDGYIVE